MDGLTEGRIVHYVMPNGNHRPAIIVNAWKELSPPCDGYANLQVFTDGTNDLIGVPDVFKDHLNAIASGTWWVTSICNDETDKERGTWHWIEKA